MTNKSLREISKIISALVGKEMQVDNMDNLCNAIYTGLYIVMNTGKDEKIKKLFVGLASRVPKKFKPRLTEGFKNYLNPKVVIKEVEKNKIHLN